MGFAKTAFCVGVKCNQERPYRSAVKGRGYVCMFCGEPVQLPSKYRNEPTRSTHTGRLYQSKKEARREPILLALQNAGVIGDLQYQVPFRLELYATGAVDDLLREVEDVWERVEHGLGTRLRRLAEDVRRSRQLVCTYKADFTYRDQHGALVVEDPKGFAKSEYRIKKRLMVLAHNVEIVQPEEGGIQQRARGAGIRGVGTGSRLMGGR